MNEKLFECKNVEDIRKVYAVESEESTKETVSEKVRIKKSVVYDDEIEFAVYLINKEDETADGFAEEIDQWVRKNGLVHIEDTKVNEDYDYGGIIFDDTKNKFHSLAKFNIKSAYAKDLEKWLRSGQSSYIKQ